MAVKNSHSSPSTYTSQSWAHIFGLNLGGLNYISGKWRW